MRTIEGELAICEAFAERPKGCKTPDEWEDAHKRWRAWFEAATTGYPAALRALAAIKQSATIMPDAGDTKYMRSVIERFERGEFDE